MKKLVIGASLLWWVVFIALTLFTGAHRQNDAPVRPYIDGKYGDIWMHDDEGRYFQCEFKQAKRVYSGKGWPMSYWWCTKLWSTPIPTLDPAYYSGYPYNSGDYP